MHGQGAAMVERGSVGPGWEGEEGNCDLGQGWEGVELCPGTRDEPAEK